MTGITDVISEQTLTEKMFLIIQDNLRAIGKEVPFSYDALRYYATRQRGKFLNPIDLLDCNSRSSFTECCYLALLGRLPEIELTIDTDMDADTFRSRLVRACGGSLECIDKGGIVVGNVFSEQSLNYSTSMSAVASMGATPTQAFNNALRFYHKLPRVIRVIIRKCLGIRDQ
jgi:hypothetical protein